jgi:dolichyl-phosphate-mannose--protein O-mannosyl transferase
MLANQASMWDYHSNMKSTHPSSSPWYTWPIMSMPVWYYSGGEWTGPAKVSTIMAFGNPLVWYLGTIAFVLAFGWRLILVKSKKIVQKFQVTENQTLILGFILICGLTQFLPWALIPRKLVFIYHFFASVPFIILALVWGLQRLEIYNPTRVWIRYLPWSLVAIAAVLFIAYFPVISGLPVPRAWPELINYGPVDLFF